MCADKVFVVHMVPIHAYVAMFMASLTLGNVPSPLSCTASDGKLGEDLRTRLELWSFE